MVLIVLASLGLSLAGLAAAWLLLPDLLHSL
jgi:hypothetical protein